MDTYVFLKDHLDHKKGDELPIDSDRAKYLVACGVVKKKPKKTSKKAKK